MLYKNIWEIAIDTFTAADVFGMWYASKYLWCKDAAAVIVLKLCKRL